MHTPPRRCFPEAPEEGALGSPRGAFLWTQGGARLEAPPSRDGVLGGSKLLCGFFDVPRRAGVGPKASSGPFEGSLALWPPPRQNPGGTELTQVSGEVCGFQLAHLRDLQGGESSVEADLQWGLLTHSPRHPTRVLALRSVRMGGEGRPGTSGAPRQEEPAKEAPGSLQQPRSRGRACLIRAVARQPTCR